MLVVVMRASAAFYIFFSLLIFSLFYKFFAFSENASESEDTSQSSSFYAPRTFFLKQMAKKRKSLNLNLESLAAKTLVKMRLQPLEVVTTDRNIVIRTWKGTRGSLTAHQKVTGGCCAHFNSYEITVAKGRKSSPPVHLRNFH